MVGALCAYVCGASMAQLPTVIVTVRMSAPKQVKLLIRGADPPVDQNIQKKLVSDYM